MAGFRFEYWFRHVVVVVFLLLGPHATGAHAAEKVWPTNGWRTSTPEAQGMRSEMLADMLERIRGNGYRIHSVTIVRNGHLVLDAYFHPFQKGWRHPIHSVTKSIMSALIGIAIDKGYIAGVDTPVLGFFPDKAVAHVDARKRAMTLEHLLTMTTGFKCRDSYRYRWVGFKKILRSTDWTQFVLDLPMEGVPGKKFEYCNGASFLLSAILAKATKTDTFEFAKKHLFAPLGISDVTWSKSPRGIAKGHAEMWLTPHDMAKFGWLFLNKGKWDRRQVVSSAWVDRSTRHHVDAKRFDHYGYQWWGDAHGYYMAVGYLGQRIFVVPQKSLVVVFTGRFGRSTLTPKTLLDKFIIPAAKSDVPLPADAEQQKRLTSLIEASARAPKQGYVWKSLADGTARDGVFVRRKSPAFQFKFPLGSQREVTRSPTEVMRMRTLSAIWISARVADIPEGVALADVGPVSYAAILGRLGSNVKIVSNKKITLRDGTAGYRTDFQWLYGSFLWKTVVVSVFKDGKWVSVAAHNWKNPNVVSGLLESLTFRKSN